MSRLATWRALASILALASLAAPLPARSDLPPLYPRESFFSNPERANACLSPDGLRLSWVAPTADGVLNVWVQTLGREDARAVTSWHDPGVVAYYWTGDSRRILFLADQAGDENAHLFSVELEGGPARDLTPYPGVRATNLVVNEGHPGAVLIGLNRRTPRLFDMYRVDLATGTASLEAENPGDVVEWCADRALRIRACAALDSLTADVVIRVRDRADGPWRSLARWPFGENNDIIFQKVIGFGPGDTTLVVQNSLGAPTSRLKEVSLATGRDLRTIAADERCDVANFLAPAGLAMEAAVLTDPADGRILAAGFERERLEWKAVDPQVEPDLERLRKGLGCPFAFRARTAERWLVRAESDTAPAAYYLYDRARKALDLLFEDRPDLKSLRLAPMKPVTIPARDGLRLPGYLTLPAGVPATGLPLVLAVHGGPWFRDSWGYDGITQWLANRGYAVLQVNFRGSTGFGKRHLMAGTGQWGVGAMQHDLTDAVKWAVAEGIADPERVVICGGSYGGYAALCGAAFTPDLYAAVVDIVGPSNVRTLFASFPPYWGPRKIRWVRRVGDVERDDALNRRISPLFHVERIRAPLLIGHGANDPRVKLAESQAIAAALQKAGKEVTLVVYPDEGHGFERPQNNLDFFGRMEEFLGKRLDVRYEPWRAVPGATGKVEVEAR